MSDATPVEQRPVGPDLESPYSLAVFDDQLRSIPLLEGTLIFGRSKEIHVRLEDRLLSRKHCSLTVAEDRVLLVDLNSANGTFVNGERISSCELTSDDIIELGRTVMVLYDGSTWSRGEGLLHLRNPVKAQQLVQRLRGGSDGLAQAAPVLPGAPRNGVRRSKGLTDLERAFFAWLERGDDRLLGELVAEYLTHKLTSLVARNSVAVRSALTATLERAMHPQFYEGIEGFETFRAAVAERFRKELRAADEGAPPEPQGGASGAAAAADSLESSHDS